MRLEPRSRSAKALHRLLCRLLGDYLACVDDRDLMLGPRLVLDGFWESWVTLAIARHLQRGCWCVDVGPNYGSYTLLMAGACGGFPHAAVVMELHRQRDPPQTVGFLHEIERGATRSARSITRAKSCLSGPTRSWPSRRSIGRCGSYVVNQVTIIVWRSWSAHWHCWGPCLPAARLSSHKRLPRRRFLQ